MSQPIPPIPTAISPMPVAIAAPDKAATPIVTPSLHVPFPESIFEPAPITTRSMAAEQDHFLGVYRLYDDLRIGRCGY
jgi:hypothetical protein